MRHPFKIQRLVPSKLSFVVLFAAVLASTELYAARPFSAMQRPVSAMPMAPQMAPASRPRSATAGSELWNKVKHTGVGNTVRAHYNAAKTTNHPSTNGAKYGDRVKVENVVNKTKAQTGHDSGKLRGMVYNTIDRKKNPQKYANQKQSWESPSPGESN